MRILPSRCKRHPVLTAVLSWLIVMTPVGMTAEAAFHLDRVDGSAPTTGLRFLPEVQGLQTTALVPGMPARPPVTHRIVRHAPTRLPGAGSGRCGGDLPPCWVMMRESRGDPNAFNPTGCSGRGCYGKWQFDPRTGNGRGSEAEQDAEARRVWDDGRGCSHWNACP